MTSVVRLVSKRIQADRTSTGSELPKDDAQLWTLLIAEANYWSLVPIMAPGKQKTQLARRRENQFPKGKFPNPEMLEPSQRIYRQPYY